MNNSEYDQLNTLYEDVKERDKLFEEISKLNKAYEKQKKICKPKVDQFDKENMKSFVESKIGKAPKKPAAAISANVATGGVLTPVMIKKIQKYSSEMEYYEELVAESKEEYYEFYRKEREALIAVDRKIFAAILDPLNQKKEEYKIIVERIENNKIVDDTLKNAGLLYDLIMFFDDGRANTISEALAIWCAEEQNRKQIAKANKEERKNEKKRKKMERSL